MRPHARLLRSATDRSMESTRKKTAANGRAGKQRTGLALARLASGDIPPACLPAGGAHPSVRLVYAVYGLR